MDPITAALQGFDLTNILAAGAAVIVIVIAYVGIDKVKELVGGEAVEEYEGADGYMYYINPETGEVDAYRGADGYVYSLDDYMCAEYAEQARIENDERIRQGEEMRQRRLEGETDDRELTEEYKRDYVDQGYFADEDDWDDMEEPQNPYGYYDYESQCWRGADGSELTADQAELADDFKRTQDQG